MAKTAAPAAKTAAAPAAPAKGAAVPPAKGAAVPPAKGAALPLAAAATKPAGLTLHTGPKPGAPAGKPGAPAGKPGAAAKPAKKGGRKAVQRRGPDGELLAPGELLLPKGPTHPDEIQYLLRGCAAAEHTALEAGVNEIIAKKGPQAEMERAELVAYGEGMSERYEKGSIEPLLPLRPQGRRNFQGVVERAKHRRREIGAFLRGLDLGRTEISHMDSHGEASMQSLMEWAARLEVLSDADEPQKADYTQFLRVLDQLDSTTESLIVDVELTLKRQRDRPRAGGKH